jgi:hypothetical protein
MVKPAKPSVCHGCGATYPSRNAVFRHLRETNGACLLPEDYQNFVQFAQSRDLRKTIVLYGYLPSKDGATLEHDAKVIGSGNDAARFLLEAMDCPEERINRSYGCNVRGNEIVAQDDATGAISEVLTARLPELATTSVQEWKNQLQRKLPECMRILGRLDMPHNKFNAEMDVSHRRVEYLLPADILFTGGSDERSAFFASLPNFKAGHLSRETNIKSAGLEYLYKLKKLMQLLTTQIVELDQSDASAVLEKKFHNKRRKRNRTKQQQKRDDKRRDQTETNIKKDSDVDNVKTENSKTDKNVAPQKTDKNTTAHVLRRRRFHNFTPRVMAHEFLAYRRLDRFYHRATLRYDDRPFLSVSLTGDLFLQGQAVRVIGLWLALARNLIDQDIVECIFDEQYPHLIPTPPVPAFALYAGEAAYMTWEGKSKMILNPRRCDRYSEGWNSDETLQGVAEWQETVHEAVAQAWMQDGVDADGRLVAEREWTEQVLEPWAERAKKQLEDYRLWKAAQRDSEISPVVEAILPPIESVDATIPVLFEKVLHYLREADASGLWPSTTPKRQLVMISNLTDEAPMSVKSLSAAHMKAKANKVDRSSAYEFTEGQGGASGSFSVGAMPGDQCIQPKANTLFPELMKYAFELEIALCPNREPSSTIAINRNAQFRPHTDNGTGAGQSTSLIVGLGHYVGGELVVEGERKDIRYKAVEFNGWTQRHWTMPFRGERFSLVWFTPKGCEGVRGIDLCQK